MFKALSERLTHVLGGLRGAGRLTEQNIRDALRDVRLALLEADVALPVVQAFTERARERALGAEVLKSLTPGQALIKIVHAELTAVLGGDAGLDLKVAAPAVILLVGLQGAGKTTTAAKLAQYLKQRLGKRVLLASSDVQRPAAREQLERLALEIGAGYFSESSADPIAIATAALAEARARLYDVLVLDSAGRLHADVGLMEEARRIHAAVAPVETLFVLDAMAGQDAAPVAAEFARVLPLTGVVLSKTDGDARGGAALSARHLTGAPIKFLGTGEKPAALEVFQAERFAARILGMGDVLALVEAAQHKLDREQADVLAHKLKQGKRFDLADFRSQLQQMLDMGGVGAMLDKLPGATAAMAQKVQGQFGDRELKRQVAIIDSMTRAERAKPDLLNGSRRRRIAAGSGTEVQEVNRLLKQYEQFAQVMQQMAGGGMARMLRGLKGGLPPGFRPR
jgi:signal recognition particle subunit SRP54